MERKKILTGLIALVLFLLFYFTFFSSSEKTYQETIEKERSEKDWFMKNSRESPFSTSKKEFKSLSYFPIAGKYNIVADFEKIEGGKVRLMPTNDGVEEPYREYGYASFNWEGKPCRLLILELMEEGPAQGKLWLGFGDLTSAGETYGGGRYLDVDQEKGRIIQLDFNKAYNPYCAYGEGFSCPLPPPENLLNIEIRAGEKSFHHP